MEEGKDAVTFTNEMCPETNSEEELTRKKLKMTENPQVLARGYQTEILEMAKKSNIIVYLPTGAGKTHIAVMLLLYKAKLLKTKKILSIFLAPTIPLAQQQAEVIKRGTSLVVMINTGSDPLGGTDIEGWQAQIKNAHVLVMTPQIFLNLLIHAIVKLEMIDLLTFDECHHAQKNHPYAEIMRTFYRPLKEKGLQRPSIFGMTASPVISKGVESQEHCASHLKGLEDILDAKLCTVQDVEELEEAVPTAAQNVYYYDPPVKSWDKVRDGLESLVKYMEDKVREEIFASKNGSNLESLLGYIAQPKVASYDTVLSGGAVTPAVLFKKAKKRIGQMSGNLQFCLEDLGLRAAVKAAESSLSDIKNGNVDLHIEDMTVREALLDVRRRFLVAAVAILKGANFQGERKLSTNAIRAEVNYGLVTPKVQLLVEVLSKFRGKAEQGQLRCIVFVERKIAACVLAELLPDFEDLPFLKCSFLVGCNTQQSMTHPVQHKTITDFREGKINTIVSTSIGEEGLDIVQCHAVIRFDLSKTVRSHIQSRGRARQKDSLYITLAERANAGHEDLMRSNLQSEQAMRAETLERNFLDKVVGSVREKEDHADEYRVHATGAVVNTRQSISLIHSYCDKLPRDRYSSGLPLYMLWISPGAYQVELFLPTNSLVRHVAGPPHRNRDLAKEGACLEAVKQLHLAGGLSDHLIPVSFPVKDAEDIKSDKYGGNGPRLGTRKHLYEVKLRVPSALCSSAGTTASAGSTITSLYAYSVIFDQLEMAVHSSFTVGLIGPYVLLTEKSLPEEAASMAVQISLPEGTSTWARMRACGNIRLTPSQMALARQFHRTLFCKVLHRSDDGSVSTDLATAVEATAGVGDALAAAEPTGISTSEGPQQAGVTVLPDTPQRSYLLLPLSANKACTPDWNVMSNALAAWGLKEQLPLPDVAAGEPQAVVAEVNRADPCGWGTSKDEEGLTAKAKVPVPPPSAVNSVMELKMASSVVAVEQLVGMVVKAVHNGMEYFVRRIRPRINATSKFPNEAFATFEEYYLKRYKQQLRCKEQPFLSVGLVKRARNCLLRPFPSSIAEKERAPGQVPEHQEEDAQDEKYIVLPPELCRPVLPASLFRSAQLLPSVMHRLEAMLLACELRDHICSELKNSGHDTKLPACKMLEVLTSSECQEEISLERFELLGDAFLKFAVSCHLFKKFPFDHEGLLSAKRSKAVQNITLVKVAISKGLTEFLRTSPFDVMGWDVPGVPSACKHRYKAGPDKKVQLATNDSAGDALDTVAQQPKGLNSSKADSEVDAASSNRKIQSKLLADMVEALIGAFWSELGEGPALALLQWLGILNEGSSPSPTSRPLEEGPSVEVQVPLAAQSPAGTGVEIGPLSMKSLESLEARIGYSFSDKALLLEAVTHASYLEQFWRGRKSSYQRLEFLGDAVLDLHVTRQVAGDSSLDPGKLTDLRSASVNNEAFARVAVRDQLQLHRFLLHSSDELREDIREYIQSQQEASSCGGLSEFASFGEGLVPAPKVLGDLVESITGAVFVDLKFNADGAWSVVKQWHLPVATMETMSKQPNRQLLEFCQMLGIQFRYVFAVKGDVHTVEVVIKDEVLVSVMHKQKKVGKKIAAIAALRALQAKGLEPLKPVEGNRQNRLIKRKLYRQEMKLAGLLPIAVRHSAPAGVPNGKVRFAPEAESLPLVDLVSSEQVASGTTLVPLERESSSHAEQAAAQGPQGTGSQGLKDPLGQNPAGIEGASSSPDCQMLLRLQEAHQVVAALREEKSLLANLKRPAQTPEWDRKQSQTRIRETTVLHCPARPSLQLVELESLQVGESSHVLPQETAAPEQPTTSTGQGVPGGGPDRVPEEPAASAGLPPSFSLEHVKEQVRMVDAFRTMAFQRQPIGQEAGTRQNGGGPARMPNQAIPEWMWMHSSPDAHASRPTSFTQQAPRDSGHSASGKEIGDQGKATAELHEMCSKMKWTCYYECCGISGEPHLPWFTMQVTVQQEGGRELIAIGDAMLTKKKAKNSSSLAMLSLLRTRPIF